LALALVSACASHLSEAKSAYAKGQELSRSYRSEQAVAAYKRALAEAGLEARGGRAAQAYTIMGLAQVNLGLWKEAEANFAKAFSLGFEPGEAWASDVALLGLAVSCQELGLQESTLRTYNQLLGKSTFKPVLMAAAQKYADLVLSRSLNASKDEKEHALSGLVRTIEKLESGDYACGIYHYYHSQAESHRGDLRRSYDEAVMARELGLPSEKILRDNDNQIVFCFDRLKEILAGAGREAFVTAHEGWAKRWGWRDARTPGWQAK
jgi:tetratricopeptide (TPR) repeat protein